MEILKSMDNGLYLCMVRESELKQFGKLPEDTNSLQFGDKEGFFNWLSTKGFSEDHIEHMTGYFNGRLYGLTFNNPYDLHGYVFMNLKGQGNIIKTARNYLNYLEQTEKVSEDYLKRYRKVLKIKKNRPIVYCPLTSEVMKNYNIVKDHPALKAVYLVLACSGVRYTEALRFLKDFDPAKFRQQGDYISYPIVEARGHKTVNNIYLPLFVLKELVYVSNTYDSLRGRAHKKGCTFSLKYLRKWFYNFAREKGVPRDVVNWMQGRNATEIDSMHYCDNEAMANAAYAKLAPEFEALFNPK